MSIRRKIRLLLENSEQSGEFSGKIRTMTLRSLESGVFSNQTIVCFERIRTIILCFVIHPRTF
jgi:hypothetical protein